jgi:hypothetical protein
VGWCPKKLRFRYGIGVAGSMVWINRLSVAALVGFGLIVAIGLA